MYQNRYVYMKKGKYANMRICKCVLYDVYDCICTYVCRDIQTYVRMYLRTMYKGIHVSMCLRNYASKSLWIVVSLYLCIFASLSITELNPIID